MKFIDILNRAAQDEQVAESISIDEIYESLDGFVLPERRMRYIGGAPLELRRPPYEIDGIEWRHGAYRPKNVEDVQKIVIAARANGRKVRTSGARHSEPDAVFSSNPNDFSVVLEGTLRCFEVKSQTDAEIVVRVGAGCYLGVNPADPESNLDNSLTQQLDVRGYALPILGGISHQSVAGFIQTSSSGGSLTFRFADAVKSIELVDGTGKFRTLDAGTPEFNAVGVSIGLFGVLTHVVLVCKRRYFVKGNETNHQVEKDSLLLKKAGVYPLEKALHDVEFLHLNWFAQKEVKRVTQWLGTSHPNPPATCDPYDSELKSKLMNVVAAVVLAITSGLIAIDPDGPGAAKLVGFFLKKFVPLDKNETFDDVWRTVLPCDDQVDVDHLIKIIFTEIWLPLDQLTASIDRLKTILESQTVAGNFAVELYGAKESPFWLSPSYKQDVVRVDVFWWAYNFGDPKKHFTDFWNVLLELPGARLHWGKGLPRVGQKCGKVVFGPDFIAARYPKFGEWKKIRQQFDPDGVFVTSHWGDVFGI